MVAPGETVAFTGMPYGNLSFVDDDGRMPTHSWYYYENDTLPEHSTRGGRWIGECYGKEVCNYRPSRSGRMAMATYVQARYVLGMSEVVWVRDVPRELVMECKEQGGAGRVGTVVRGGSIACALTTEPAGGKIEVTEWSFTGEDSRGRPYRFPTADDSPEQGTAWGGRMVISGDVMVRATVDGKPTDDTERITVEARGLVYATCRVQRAAHRPRRIQRGE